LNTAAYSPRPGTPAAENQLSEEVKSDRLRVSTTWSRSKQSRDRNAISGRIEEVLVETKIQNPSQVMGRTRQPPHLLQATLPNSGELVQVKITEVRAFSLTGEPVEVRQVMPV